MKTKIQLLLIPVFIIITGYSTIFLEGNKGLLTIILNTVIFIFLMIALSFGKNKNNNNLKKSDQKKENKTIEQRLDTLNELFFKELITEDEFKQKKQEILKEL